jgi:iron complex outermembrane receptor protein
MTLIEARRGSMTALHVVLLAGALPCAAFAQEAAPPATPQPAGAQPTATGASTQPPSSDGLQDIIVTAEKRDQRLQDVPVAIQAVTAQAMATRGISGTSDLQVAVPGLAFAKTVTYGNFYLRGVGNNLYGPNTEAPVAIFIDGVYIPSAEANTFNFNNIQQIEVLKGPQGTLFGRNTTGGVVQITTRDPKQTPGLEFNVGYANYDTVTVSGYGTTGITDNLAIDLAGLYANQGDGYGRNFTTGSKTFIQARNNYAFRSKLFWDLDDTTIRIGGDYSHSYNNDAYQVPKGVTGADGVTTYPGPYNAVGQIDDFIRVNTGGGSLQVDHDFGAVRVVSISSYRFSHVANVIDQDQTPQAIVEDSFPSRQRDFTQELRVQNGAGSRIHWVLGGFFYDAKAAYVPADISIANTHLIIDDYQKTRSVAVFGETTIPLGDKTNLTGGLRWTTETQHFGVNTYTFGGVPTIFPGDKQTFSKVTWRAAIDHHLDRDLMVYASVNRGFKSGGYNLFSPTDPPYKPETLDAYELGIKSELFDRKLRLNIDGFYYDYSNIQAQIPFAGGNRVVNGPRAHIKGLEVEVQASPVHALNLTGSVSLIDGKYTDYPAALYVFPQGGFTTINAVGNRVPNTPTISANFNADYTFETSFGRITPAVTGSYSNGYFAFPDNRLAQPTYALLNATVSWTSNSGRYNIKAWAKNLTNKLYFESLTENAGLGDVQRFAPPRTYGLTLGVKL